MSDIKKLIIVTGNAKKAEFTGDSLSVKTNEAGTLTILDGGYQVGAFNNNCWQFVFPEGSVELKTR